MKKSNLFTTLFITFITLFIITGIAIAEDALFIDENGNVGIGETNPSHKLHISGEQHPRMKLKSNTSGTSNEVGIFFQNSDNTESFEIGLDNDGLNAFHIGNEYFSSKYMTVLNNGNVGVGDTSPNYKLDVSGNIGLTGTVSAGYTGSYAQTRLTQWGLTSTGTMYIEPGPGGRLNIVPTDWSQDLITGIYGKVGIGTVSPGSYKLYVAGSAYSTGGWLGSDKRWKENIKPLENSLEKISQLQGVSYDWKIDEYPELGFTEGAQVGLIAQDVEKIIPELVHTDDNGYMAVSYEKLTPVLVEAIKELKAENDRLVEMIAKLENRIAKLEQRK